MPGMRLRLLYTEEQIAAVVQTLADKLSSDFAGEELVLIVVMKGAFIFAADLVRKLSVPLTIDYIRLKSYQGSSTLGEVSLINELETPIVDKNVVIIEDIVDTGLSLEFLLKHLHG